jgi:hypothetical protein
MKTARCSRPGNTWPTIPARDWKTGTLRRGDRAAPGAKRKNKTRGNSARSAEDEKKNCALTQGPGAAPQTKPAAADDLPEAKFRNEPEGDLMPNEGIEAWPPKLTSKEKEPAGDFS